MSNILSLTPEELRELMIRIDEPKYRAEQIFTQLHKGTEISEMTNIGGSTKEKLYSCLDCSFPGIKRKLISKIDGTVKYLFELADKNCVESVVMKYEHGYTICVSSQVGCRMGCRFCASTIMGRVRNLEAGEILGQIISAARDLKIRISNVVMMGIGEPLDNYDNVVKFLNLVNNAKGINIGYRHISLSTCGIADKIYELSKLNLPITLSVSLHAADNETRCEIMPINNKWNIESLMRACRAYYDGGGRRISFEYTLISGKNDSVSDAKRLGELLNRELRKGCLRVPIHVNLIPVNEVKETNFKSSGNKAIMDFVMTLEKLGIRATVRRKLGADINASCGQLRRADAEST